MPNRVRSGRLPCEATLVNYLDITVASGRMRPTLQLLFAAVGFLLLIACANVANLQLARNAARSKEIVMRLAIGASRRRIIQQLLSESFLLSLIGGALGVVFAFATTNAIVALMPTFYVPNEARVTVNIYVLLFSLGVSLLTGILFGLTPALQCSRPNLSCALNEGVRGGAAFSGRRTRNALVVIEMALAVVLLASSSLAVRSFLKFYQVDPGFQPERLLMMNLPLPPAKYSTFAQRNEFAADIVGRIRRLPGVESVAIGNGGLPYGGPSSPYSIDGQAGTTPPRIATTLINEDYLKTMGIALRRGRPLSETEVVRSSAVGMLNETAARLWPAGEDPLGRTIHLDVLANPGAAALPAPGTSPDITIVGIIADARNAGLRAATAPAVFIPYTYLAPASRVLAIRTAGAPLSILNTVRQQVLEIDKEQPIGRPVTIEEILGNDFIQPRFNVALFSTLAILALALATAGIYSVISYHVARRTQEIGIRVSLGAKAADVSRLILTLGTKLVVTGLVIGVALSWALARVLQTQVFEITDLSVSSMLVVVVVLAVTALTASYIPARRASRIDPMVALRDIN